MIFKDFEVKKYTRHQKIVDCFENIVKSAGLFKIGVVMVVGTYEKRDFNIESTTHPMTNHPDVSIKINNDSYIMTYNDGSLMYKWKISRTLDILQKLKQIK